MKTPIPPCLDQVDYRVHAYGISAEAIRAVFEAEDVPVEEYMTISGFKHKTIIRFHGSLAPWLVEAFCTRLRDVFVPNINDGLAEIFQTACDLDLPAETVAANGWQVWVTQLAATDARAIA